MNEGKGICDIRCGLYPKSAESDRKNSLKPELHIFVAYGVFFGVFVLVVGILVGGFGSLIGDGVFG
ncbi:hypothetical protein [Mobiluncus mulieris]|uniref:Transmembrane protein n=1 Tax=Mobiluncus mulieris TaxID=2052 RepID=A0A7Y0UVG9_9ACTO|nr:hypothetical protein [Mobiluncus mulieris]NMX04518.1 hypothetical protein [Mobiluncus mulieris]